MIFYSKHVIYWWVLELIQILPIIPPKSAIRKTDKAINIVDNSQKTFKLDLNKSTFVSTPSSIDPKIKTIPNSFFEKNNINVRTIKKLIQAGIIKIIIVNCLQLISDDKRVYLPKYQKPLLRYTPFLMIS